LFVEREARTLCFMVPAGARLKWFAWLAVGVLLAAGCVPAGVTPTLPPLSATIRAEQATPTPPPPTPTLTTPAACPIPAGEPGPVSLSDPAATAEAVLGFLNAGGTIADLMDQIGAAGRATGQGDSWRTLDLNGDGWYDLVIALADPPAPEAARRAPGALLRLRQLGRGGSVLVLLCQGNRYVAGTPLPAESDATPILHAEAELTGDTAPDVLLGWGTCGAHTCSERFEVLSASGTQLIRRALDPSSDLPYPEATIAANGSVAITATGIASVGAGPFRRFTRSWDWHPGNQAFQLASEELDPPRYRIHALLDADAAARLGDLKGALDLYHRVVLDDSLLEWVDPATERANLAGYSMFRVVLTYLQMNDWGDAQKAYGILQNQYSSGAAGQAYAAMAQAFWDAYTATDDLEQGCRAARDYAEAHAEEVLTPLYFGYANPMYTPADVCPGEDK
jgi:hypothetical protein